MGKLKPWLMFIEGEDGGGAEGANPDEKADGNSADDKSGEDTDWKSKYESMRAEMRKQEARAKENKAAADRLAELENEGKTEAQKAADRAAEAEQRAAQAERQVLRYKAVAESGLTAEVLAAAERLHTADTAEAMSEAAKALAEATAQPKKRRTGAPGDDRDRTPPAPTLKSGADLYDRVKANLY